VAREIFEQIIDEARVADDRQKRLWRIARDLAQTCAAAADEDHSLPHVSRCYSAAKVGNMRSL
jgi:hypothetical protein